MARKRNDNTRPSHTLPGTRTDHGPQRAPHGAQIPVYDLKVIYNQVPKNIDTNIACASCWKFDQADIQATDWKRTGSHLRFSKSVPIHIYGAYTG